MLFGDVNKESSTENFDENDEDEDFTEYYSANCNKSNNIGAW